MLRRTFIKDISCTAGAAAVVAPPIRALGKADRPNTPTVNVLLWFDTEDYINPIADDAALRIANDLTKQGIRATFKLVGEQARMLERRRRQDVIDALKRHDIGYHSNWHSLHPVGPEYLESLGYLEGADDFQRREEPGIRDIQRIFGVLPSCYGQPGFAWAPQANLALRRLGIPIYLDHDTQIGINHQPFYLSNLLYVFDMSSYFIHPDFDSNSSDPLKLDLMNAAVSRLRESGGGTITTWLHPNECVELEFWDAINFDHGAQPPRPEWKTPKLRTPQDAERCYKVMSDFIKQVSQIPGVRWINASQLFSVYERPSPPSISPKDAAQHFRQNGITFLQSTKGNLSASEVLLQMLELRTPYVDGPTSRGVTTFAADTIRVDLFAAAKADFADAVRVTRRFPPQVYLGSESLSLADFAATVAANVLDPSSPVSRCTGDLLFEKYVSTDARYPFRWGVLPVGFSAPHLMELTRLQAWTLKPARLLPA